MSNENTCNLPPVDTSKCKPAAERPRPFESLTHVLTTNQGVQIETSTCNRSDGVSILIEMEGAGMRFELDPQEVLAFTSKLQVHRSEILGRAVEARREQLANHYGGSFATALAPSGATSTCAGDG